MNIMIFVEEGKHLISTLDRLLARLAKRLRQPSTLVTYRCILQRDSPEITETLLGDVARKEIAQDICRLDYPDKKDIDDPDEVTVKDFICSSVQIPANYLSLIEEINLVKQELQDWHERVLATQTTKAEKQHFLRKIILKKCNRPRLNLDACDAKLIATPNAITRINWNINHCRPSRRLCISDAIDELKLMSQNTEEEQISVQIDKEITALQSLNPTTPVAACYGRGVKVLRYQARLIDENSDLSRLSGHAANPIFYSGTYGQTPVFLSPSPNKKNNVGRPITISNNIVTYSLPNWFFYNVTKSNSTPPKKIAPQKRRKSNPIPGLRLGQRRGRTCVIAGSTSISIRKFGLQTAWEMAVDKLIELEKIIPNDREVALAMCPKETDI